MKTEVIAFRKNTPANSVPFVLKERAKANGRVTEVRIRFYPGVEKALRVKPYVLHKGNRAEDFITYQEGSEQYISGDNEYLIFPVSIDFQYDDEICVWGHNYNQLYQYSLSVDVIVTYFEDEVL